MSLHYFILANSTLILGFILYKWTSIGTRRFKINRYFLISLPLAVLLLSFLPHSSTIQTIRFNLPTIDISSLEGALSEETSFNWMLWVYTLGLLFQLLLFTFRLFKVFQLDRSNKLTQLGNVRIYRTTYKQSFSVGKDIFLSDRNIDDADIIIQHELIHVNQFHTLDILIYQIYCCLFWFNPIIYLLEKEVKENHEFLVDQEVVQQHSIESYSSSILSTQLNSTYPHLGAGFNKKSTLLKRIQKMKTQNNYIMKHLVLIPALVLGSFTMTSLTTNQSPSTKVVLSQDEKIVQPSYKGGMEALSSFIGENVTYPKSIKDKEATVFVSFLVKENGSIADVKLLKSSQIKEFDMEAIRVIKLMPAWNPGTKDGKVVDMQMTLPIKFTDK